MTDSEFGPDEIEVDHGEEARLRFRNRGRLVHSAMEGEEHDMDDMEGMDMDDEETAMPPTGDIDPGQTKTVTASFVADTVLHCDQHPDTMTMVVTVNHSNMTATP
jgi:uncharacterized cupredoxin-like copper-binding protein